MEPIRIPCPQCGSELKLRDRSLLGRIGRCPSCDHRFRLEEPDEVDLNFASAGGWQAASEPVVGTGARWVPDDDADAPPLPLAPPPGSAPRRQPPRPRSTATVEPPLPPPVGSSDGGIERLRELRRTAKRRRNFGIVIGLLTALMVAGGVYGVQKYMLRKRVVVVDKNAGPPPAVDRAWVDRKDAMQENLTIATAFDPTKGEPIKLNFVPHGANIVVNLRPAEFWKADSRGEYFRFSLGPLGEWTGATLKEFCRYEPQEIEEALICVHLGPRGTPPEFSTVVRLVQEQKKSDLLKKFAGELTEEYGRPVYLDGDFAYLLWDLKTIAIGPREHAGEMAETLVNSAVTSDGILEMLTKTDRQRHATIVFQPLDLQVHEEVLFSEPLRPLVRKLLERLTEDTETVAWSMHLTDRFYTDLKLRNHNVSSPARLQRKIRKNLDELPFEMLSAVQKMQPEQQGRRQLIGRFPAMLHTYAIGTLGGISDRYAQMTTVLPEQAAPNLAIGTLLAWDEAARTDFNRTVDPTPTTPTDLPKTIAERLKKPVDVDFNRMPLQEAIDFIASETRVRIEIDGDALKLSGYTKNMAQTYKLGLVPAVVGLQTILKPYDKMCLVVDEEKQLATLTTIPVATDRGQKPFAFGP